MKTIRLLWSGKYLRDITLADARKRENRGEVRIAKENGEFYAIALEGVSFGRIFLTVPMAEDNFTITRFGSTYSHHARRCAAYGPADGRLSACCI